MKTKNHNLLSRAFIAGCVLAPAAFVIAPAHAQMRMSSAELAPLRPPSVPLVAHDPYFSIWSNSNKLYSDATRHWTNREQQLSAMARIDGQTFKLMGNQPEESAALPQKNVLVTPTRTIYTFQNDKVQVQLVFLTPAIPSDLEVLARPVTYLSFLVRSLDGQTHDVQFYADADANIAVNDENSQEVEWERASKGGITALKIGSTEQPVLVKRGDDLRIDWGYLYLAAPNQAGLSSAMVSRDDAQMAWARGGQLPKNDAPMAATLANRAPVAALAFNVGKVGAQPVSRTMMVAYDDEYSILWMGRNLRPYWRRNGMDALGLLNVAAKDYASLNTRSIAFDNELMNDMRQVGGEKFARICALAHRQALAAQKIVADENGAPLSFSKENNSNGSIGTVDLMYPASPQMMLLSPTLLKATMEPTMVYSSSARWPFDFAPHDVGTYPKATGMTYGSGESIPANGDVSGKMPVEESGNMLILLGALSEIEGNTSYADRHWPTITKWANYLISKGYDLDNQLSTDDFSGHLAHNVNLSGKSIEALGAYAKMAGMRGDMAESERVKTIAQGMSKQWQDAARDGDHYKLAFDKSGTWSQKYNIVWDDILDIDLFPASVDDAEIAYYKTKLNRYGLPLDSRADYTKLDWTLWVAAMTNRKADVEAFAGPVYDFLNDSPSRVPMTDWYNTVQGTQTGFKARSAVGGVFMPMLNDKQIWSKWAGRDLAASKNVNFNWASMPAPPVVTTILPTSEKQAVTWKYVTAQPAGQWFGQNYDDSSWKTGDAGFGSGIADGATIRTDWTEDDIWARREFTLTAEQLANRSELQIAIRHDDNGEVYLNGVQATRVPGANNSYEMFPISRDALAALKVGVNVLSFHVHEGGGDQFADAGLVSVKQVYSK